jgi:Tfp pilus assembly protein PilX
MKVCFFTETESDMRTVLTVMKDERGIALILTMSMLVILSLLGVLVMNATDTELRITSNYRSASDAFTTAEMATEYATRWVINEKTSVDDLSADSDLTSVFPAGAALDADGTNQISTYVGGMPGEMMSGTGVDAYRNNIYRITDGSATDGEVIFYRTSVQSRVNNRSTARIEKLFVHRGGRVY